MIYTVTLNPAVDYVMRLDEFSEGTLNRSAHEDIFIGGKGINVSLVLKELGFSSTALGFIAGFTGEAIENHLVKSGIKTDFVKLESGFSRINVKIKSGAETELNARGPEIGKNAMDNFLKKFDAVKDGDIVILAGSVPASLPTTIYETILKMLSGKNIKTVVDATNDLLLNSLKFKPFLIKPNKFELEEIFSENLKNDDDIIKCAKSLQTEGAQNVLVSLGKDGAILLDEYGNTHKARPAKGEVKNSVGAGDSMVAGFLTGYLKTSDFDYALSLGSAAGGATAFSSGLAKRDEILNVFEALTKNQ